MIEIFLDLQDHCIETALKNSYERLISQYFRSKVNNQETEGKLELLSRALSQLDFPALRTAHKPLAGGSKVQVLLQGEVDDNLTISLDGFPIDVKLFVRLSKNR